VFAGHDGGLTSGLFSSDGKNVITGGEDGTVRIWNPKTGACKHVFEGHSGHEAAVTCLASSVVGDKVLSGGVDGKVLLLQISGKRVLRAFDFSSDGKNSASTATATAVEEGEEGEDGVDTTIECVGFCQAADFPWAAAGGADKKLRVWDINTGAIRCVCMHQGSVVSLKWLESSPVVCTAALDCVVRLWDARSGSCLQELTGHTDLVTSLDMRSLMFTSASAANAGETEQTTVDVIVSVSDDKTARVFHVSAKDLLP
jgi:ribosome assembly protein SQT1